MGSSAISGGGGGGYPSPGLANRGERIPRIPPVAPPLVGTYTIRIINDSLVKEKGHESPSLRYDTHTLTKLQLGWHDDHIRIQSVLHFTHPTPPSLQSFQAA